MPMRPSRGFAGSDPVDSSRTVLVLTSCTGRKDPAALSGQVAAECLYIGEQHRRLMRGVHALRESPSALDVDLRILSAGHGVVKGSRRLKTYDASFSGLGGPAIDEEAERLRIRTSLRNLLRRDHALILLLLGEDYMRAAGIGSTTKLGGPTIAFGGRWLERRGEDLPLRVVPAGREEARHYSCGVVGLKGELAARLLEVIAREPEVIDDVSDPNVDIVEMLDRVGGEPELALA
jgi:hypothetical protein